MGQNLITGVWNTGDIWSLKLSEDWGRVVGTPRKLLSFPATQVEHFSFSAGRLIFGARSINYDIASIETDAGSGAAAGEATRLTDDPEWSGDGSVSLDGTRLAYAGETADRSMRVWIKDLRTGEARIVNDRLMPAGAVRISPDGRQVAFAGLEGGPGERFDGRAGTRQEPALYVHDLAKRETREICEDCGQAEGWMSSSDKILMTIDPPEAGDTSIWLVDVASASRTLLAENLHFPTPVFSHDDRRVVFGDGDRILSAAFRGDRLAPQGEWTELISGGRVRYCNVSPDGRVLYFTSNRDSYWCIWARRIDPDSGAPAGEVFPVHHAHRFRSGMAQSFGTNLTVAGNRLIFNWVEDSGNIWMVEGVGLD